MALTKIPKRLRDKYEIHEWRSASAILMGDFPAQWKDIADVLSRFRLLKSQVVVGGGSKTKIAGWIDEALTRKGWREKHFSTSINVDDRVYASPTHKVDCFKNGVGLEIEWNNKDPFFDRDLNNFRLLFDLRALAVGVIVTRCDELETIFKDLVKRGLKPSSSYGESTTHMGKLLPRLDGGGGGGCPVLVFGIKPGLYVEDVSDEAARGLLASAAAEKKRKAAEKLLRKQKGVSALLDVQDADDEESDE